MKKENIAVLITSFNRKEKTIKCLTSLYAAYEQTKECISLDVFLVDDNSEDGTPEEVKRLFPQVILIKGTGKLYWSGGMRVAYNHAKKRENYSTYLLLNDDVELEKNIFKQYEEINEYSLKHYNKKGVYVCSTKSPKNGRYTYGGKKLKKNIFIVKKENIVPEKYPVPCDMANANILFVANDVINEIGFFDLYFVQKFADLDFTFRVSQKGIPLLVCPGYGGYCEKDHGPDWLPQKIPLKKRLEYLYSPKGLEYKQQKYYLKKHFRFQMLYYIPLLWLKTFFPIIWEINSRKKI